jgi:hypothetical protein
MKGTRLVVVAAVFGALVMTMTPGLAVRRANCVLAGTVSLSGPANLVTTTYGTGSFTPSSALQCTGPVSGKGSPAGSFFYFCQHNFVGPNPACHAQGYNGPNTNLDKVYDAVNKTQLKIASHAIGSASFSGFTGGVSCSLSFEGHAFGTVAELKITGFSCSNGYNGTGSAYATAVPTINNVKNCPPGPGNVKLCFTKLQFSGAIAVSGP